MKKGWGSSGEWKEHIYQHWLVGLQDVCRHMDSVFKELLTRQLLQDPSSTSSSLAKPFQKKLKWDGRRGKEDQGSSKQ